MNDTLPVTTEAFWNLSSVELMSLLESSPEGLSDSEAAQRLKQFEKNHLQKHSEQGSVALFLAQFKSPITLILIAAAALSLFLHDTTDSLIIIGIVAVSGMLGFFQEKGAAGTIQKLLAIVRIEATITRNGTTIQIPADEVVPGDILQLKAGDVIAGDSLLLEAGNLYINEASLTGESMPAEKKAGTVPVHAPLTKRSNTLFMGTSVMSGTATAVVVKTGRSTEFGKVSERLKLRPPETEFQRGIRRFGYFLMEVTLLLVLAIFAANVAMNKPVLDSLLFSLALAVGLTPQLLPAIISINLSHGAGKMAKKKVIVKKLAAIENFGSMNVLCSDKTGTLTEGVVRLHAAVGTDGTESGRVLYYAFVNSSFESGFINPVDEAIRSSRSFSLDQCRKLGEIPYDFIRKRLSILLTENNRHLLVTKGAFVNILSVCSRYEKPDGSIADIREVTDTIKAFYESCGRKGLRALGVACREFGDEAMTLTKESESDMVFLGFLLFDDPPKKQAGETVAELGRLGVALKIITGDNRYIAATLAESLGNLHVAVLSGTEMNSMSEEALVSRVNAVDVFAEVEPNQKERIIAALRKAGNVVGYMGDGINDVSALHAADVSISVDSAVDVAKGAADFVLLEKNLDVLVDGIHEGRTTFANTLKYIFMATSANFGNMFSMAGASLFLPFLPLLPKQILLTNMLTDFPEMTIATDTVSQEMVSKPRRWDIGFIRKFMLTFGLLSSLFDYLTFYVLLFVLHAPVDLFRTGWFMESVLSASVIVLVVRTKSSMFSSMPGKYLMAATMAVLAATLALPFTPVGSMFGFVPLPWQFVCFVGGVVACYIMSAELVKKIFYRYIAGQ